MRGDPNVTRKMCSNYYLTKWIVMAGERQQNLRHHKSGIPSHRRCFYKISLELDRWLQYPSGIKTIHFTGSLKIKTKPHRRAQPKLSFLWRKFSVIFSRQCRRRGVRVKGSCGDWLQPTNCVRCEVTKLTMRMQNYFSIRCKIKHPLRQPKKLPRSKLFPRVLSPGLVLTEGVDSASSLLPGETCVMQIEQLRKHFSGDKPSQPVVPQQLE